MNPAFILLVLLGSVVVWFLLSFAFIPIGKFIYRIWKDAVDSINKEESEEKENIRKKRDD